MASLELHQAFPILDILRTPFALLDLGRGETAQAFDNLDDLARAIHAHRRGRGLQITGDPKRDRLVWGEAPDEDRPVIRVLFVSRGDGETVEERLTVLAKDKTAEHLRDAMLATRPQRRAA